MTTRNTRITQTATVLVALMVALSIFGGVGTVAAQEASVEQSASAVTAAPGETVELTTTFSTEELNAHGVQVILPTDWQGTMTDADGGAPNSPSGSPNVLEVVWLTSGTQTYEITYEIDVPGDAEPGDYAVGVEGSGINPDDGTQVIGSAETTITVEEPSQNEPPTASFTYSPTAPETGEQVSFDASGSSDDSAITNYEWDFDGDGTTDATGAQATETFDAAGDSDVTLTVTDDEGETDTATQTVTVSEPAPENQPPTAAFTVDPAAPEVGEDVTLDASNSADSDGSITSYEWDFDGDGTTDATGETLTTSFASAGGYDVTLTVTDDDGETDTATQTISVADAPVANQPPTASFTVTPASPDVGEDVTLDASASDDPDGSIASYEWAVDGDALASGETTTTSFESAGDYDVTLTVTDDDGETDTTTQTVSVTEAEPTTGVDVSLEPSESTITEGESDEFDIVVSNLEGSSVGAYDITLALSDGGVATFDGVEVDGESVEGDDSDLTGVTETGDTIRIEVAGQSVAGADAVIGTVNVSGDAPGVVDVTVQEAQVYDEGGDGHDIGSMSGATMTVEELQEPYFEVSSLNAPDEVTQGDDITVTATVTNTGELTGTKAVSFEFDGAAVDSEDVELDPGASTDVSFTVSSDEISAGTYTHGVVTEDDNATAEITITPPALGGFENPPQDLDDDGLYEDVNGDGVFDMGDAQALFTNRHTDGVQDNADAFDFNGDGIVDVGDVQSLFDQLT